MLVAASRSFRALATSGVIAAATMGSVAVPAPVAAVWEETPTGPETGEVVVNELFVDPDAVADSRGEFIELYNPTGRTIDLTGWTIGDEQYDRYEISGVSIEPGGFAVLSRFGEWERNGGIDADEVHGDAIVLVNRGDRVVLRDPSGALVDLVDFSTGGWPVVPGRSMALVDPLTDNGDPAAWCTSTTTLRDGDLASPGQPNSCSWSSAQLVVSEVMANPRATSDEVGEWFELTNLGGSPVDLRGFTVQDEHGESFRVEVPLVVEAGAQIVFGASADPDLNGGVHVDHAYGDAMRLLDARDELVVNDADGVLVDRIRWDDGLTFPDPNGASMVLADPALDGAVGANWCAATVRWGDGDLGTPGAPGGCTAVAGPAVVVTEIMFDPEQGGSERDGEWFELANVGDEPAVLDGHRLRTYFAEHVIDTLTIEPGGIAVLAAEGDPSKNGGVVPDHVYGRSLPLYNVAARLEIVSPEGRLVDEVRWSRDRGFPHEPGRSIELRSPSVDNALGANWCLSDDGGEHPGTPGAHGSCDEPGPVESIRINEVMRRPSVAIDTDGEWIELHNPTGSPVDLGNWRISDDGSDRYRIRSSVVVPPGGYVVVARSGDPARNGGVAADVVTGVAMVLLDERDSVVLTDQYGRVVDRVEWSTAGDLPAPWGASISLADDGASWCVTASQFGAGDRGTPGAANDCARADDGPVVVNEIHRDPAAIVDARGEWIELHNRSGSPVDLSGWTLRDDGSNTFTFDPGSPLVIPPGGFLVAGRNGPRLNGGVAVDVVYGIEINLGNRADELTLLDRDLRVVDRVEWTEGNGFPFVAGASMGLRAPDLDGSIGANWCAAVTDQGNGDLGTPGAPNVCELADEPPTEEPPADEPPADEPPTDEPPVDEPPAEPSTTPTHAVFVLGSTDCASELVVSASSVHLRGDVRSNRDVRIEGSSVVVDGTVSFGGSADLGARARTSGVIQEPGVEVPTFGWAIDELRPGGRWADRFTDDLHLHDGDLVLEGQAASLAPGVHVVDGDVNIRTNQTRLDRVTIVATGTISIESSAVELTSFAAELPALFAVGGSCGVDAVSVAASAMKIAGTVIAPSGTVRLAAPLVSVDGALLGSSVHVTGSRVAIGTPAE